VLHPEFSHASVPGGAYAGGKRVAEMRSLAFEQPHGPCDWTYLNARRCLTIEYMDAGRPGCPKAEDPEHGPTPFTPGR
jgi:hypothetical protein